MTTVACSSESSTEKVGGTGSGEPNDDVQESEVEAPVAAPAQSSNRSIEYSIRSEEGYKYSLTLFVGPDNFFVEGVGGGCPETQDAAPGNTYVHIPFLITNEGDRGAPLPTVIVTVRSIAGEKMMDLVADWAFGCPAYRPTGDYSSSRGLLPSGSMSGVLYDQYATWIPEASNYEALLEVFALGREYSITPTPRPIPLTNEADPALDADYVVRVSVRDLNGDDVSGVRLRITGLDAQFTLQGVTNAGGVWEAAVPDRGSYSVELDEATLPPSAGQVRNNPLTFVIRRPGDKHVLFALRAA